MKSQKIRSNIKRSIYILYLDQCKEERGIWWGKVDGKVKMKSSTNNEWHNPAPWFVEEYGRYVQKWEK